MRRALFQREKPSVEALPAFTPGAHEYNELVAVGGEVHRVVQTEDYDPFWDGPATMPIAEREDKDIPPIRTRTHNAKQQAIYRRKAIDLLESHGYTVYSVDQWKPVWMGGQMVQRSRDLFGMFDLEAFRGLETVGVQITSRDNLGAHVTKIRSVSPIGPNEKKSRRDYATTWLQAGRRILLIGFFQGQKGGKYNAEVRIVTLGDLESKKRLEPARYNLAFGVTE